MGAMTSAANAVVVVSSTSVIAASFIRSSPGPNGSLVSLAASGFGRGLADSLPHDGRKAPHLFLSDRSDNERDFPTPSKDGSTQEDANGYICPCWKVRMPASPTGNHP